MKREVNYDEVFDAQQQFRIILDSMSRPGKINLMPQMDIEPPADINNASVLIGFALLNADASFFVASDNSAAITPYIALNTTAQPKPVNEADFIFMDGFNDEALIADAKTGTLSYPEDSATIIISVDEIDEDALAGTVKLTLKGPGVETEKKVSLNGLNPEILNAIKEQNLEFPLGIDVMLTDKSNRILCIPRSNRFVVEINETELVK
jgi:alpha-D-ribose 1-methylphosphonate 5-triphosphate synthase subunit PhnH